MDGLSLGQVVIPGSCTVQVDIVHRLRLQAGIGQRGLHGLKGTPSFRMRGGGVIGITGETGAEQDGQRGRRALCGQQEHGGPFGNRSPLPGGIQGPASVLVHKLKGVKAEVGQAAERIHAPGQESPHPARPQHAHGQGDGDGAGRTGSRQHQGGSGAPACLRYFLGHAQKAVMTIGFAVGDTIPQELFGGQDSAGGAAQDDRIRRLWAIPHGQHGRLPRQLVGAGQGRLRGQVRDLADGQGAGRKQREDLKGGDGGSIFPESRLRCRKPSAERADDPGGGDVDRRGGQTASPGRCSWI